MDDNQQSLLGTRKIHTETYKNQANDLISYIKEGEKAEEGVWQTNVFGKTLGELIEDGIKSKISMMDDESQMKLQDTMQKIVNDSNGGLVCIII